ncbi:MAG: PspA-associated protein PspAB [Candidatus Dormibacteraceae bacterium]
MGFLDTLLGRTRLPKSNEDRLFAITTAAVGLEASAGLEPGGRAGIVFKKLPPGRFDQLAADMKQLAQLQGEDGQLTIEEHSDDFGFDWLILSGSDFQDTVATLHTIAESLLEQGLGELLLACAFRFQQGGRPVYWVYGYKQASFYPFIPAGGRTRDNAGELRLSALAKAEQMPVEPQLERWYALWGIPL